MKKNKQTLFVIAIISLFASNVAAIGMPTTRQDTAAKEILEMAYHSISSHPSYGKVMLLPEEDIKGELTGNVFVYPAMSYSTQAFKVLAKPSCRKLEDYADQVNFLTQKILDLATLSLELGMAMYDAKFEQLTFYFNNIETIETAKQGLSILSDYEYEKRDLEIQMDSAHCYLQKLQEGSPSPAETCQLSSDDELIGLTIVEIEKKIMDMYQKILEIDSSMEALKNDPIYVHAFSINDRNNVLLDKAIEAEQQLANQSEMGLKTAIEAINIAKRNFNAVSKIDISTAQGNFLVWDDDALLLVFEGTLENGGRLIPGRVDNLEWQITQGSMLVSPPVVFTVSDISGPSRLFIDEIIPEDKEILPGSTTVQIIKEGQVKPSVTKIGYDSYGYPSYRVTYELETLLPSPVVKIDLGMGTYCGLVERSRHLDEENEYRKQNLSIATRYDQYEIKKRESDHFTHTIVGIYETPIKAMNLKVKCTIDSDEYHQYVSKNDDPKSFWFWTEPRPWNFLWERKLAQRGIRCYFPPESVLYDDTLRSYAEKLSRTVATDTAINFMNAFGPLDHYPASDYDIELFERLNPDESIWSRYMLNICGGVSYCNLGLLDKSVFDPKCEKIGRTTYCWQKKFYYSYMYQQTGTYWKKMNLMSKLEFEIR